MKLDLPGLISVHCGAALGILPLKELHCHPMGRAQGKTLQKSLLSIHLTGRGSTGLTQQNGSLPAPHLTSTSESHLQHSLPAQAQQQRQAWSPVLLFQAWHQPWLPKCLCKSWERAGTCLSPLLPLGPKKLLGNGHSAVTGKGN